MRLAKGSAEIFGEFFVREGWIKTTEEFPVVNIHFGGFARFVTGLLLADGVTVGSAVLIDPKFVMRDEEGKLTISRSLLAHEIVHVLQYKKTGFTRFLFHYVTEFLKDFVRRDKWNARMWYAAYLDIPQEREAREIAAAFIKWSANKF